MLSMHSATLHRHFSRLLIVLTLVFLPLALSAQSSTGSLLGEVQDFKGARIPGATVSIKTPDSSIQRQATTNSRGEFRFETLLPGPYHIVVTAKDLSDA